MSDRRHPLVERIHYPAKVVVAWARRCTMRALAVRGTVWLAGAVALQIAIPLPAWPVATLTVALLVAGLSAAWPGSGWVSFLHLGVLVLVVVAVARSQLGLPAVGAVAALLYLHHSAAALAAQVRTDTLVAGAVLRHWVGRTAVVLAASVLVGLGLVGLSEGTPPWPAAASIGLGAVAAVGLTATSVYLLRRRVTPGGR